MNEDDQPDWYMTPDEFSGLVAEVLLGYVRDTFDGPAHPRDLAAAMIAVAEVVALTAEVIGRSK